MRSDKKKEKRKKHILPKNIGHGILLMICMLFCVLFLSMMLLVDSFPGMYVMGILGAIALIMLLIIILLNSRREKTKKRKIGAVLAVLLIITMGVGSYYMYSTYSLFSTITAASKQTEDFHVVVLAEGSYETVEDIKGEELFVIESENSRYKEAKGMLMSEADVTYKELKDYMEAGHQLVDQAGDTRDNVIFVSNTNFEMMCEEIGNFKKSTKIIHTISIEIETGDFAKRVDVTKDPFNVYISGIDTSGTIGTVARSDVNMIMTVNPETKQILLTSIPRDMYLPLHTYGALDKLTHSGIYGIQETTSTVEDWLGIDINYYLRVNFTTLTDVVDAIGGIDVNSEYSFGSSVSDYSYVAGTNHLDGEAALYFARERKQLPGGDNERIKNQQRVLTAIIDKMTSSTVLLTKYTQLLDAVGDKMQTSLSENDISAIVKAQIKDMGAWDISSNSVKGKGAMMETYSMPGRNLSVVVPDEESVTEAQKQISHIMYPVEDVIE